MTRYMDRMAEISHPLSANTLAGMADCASPDSQTSAGADFLASVRDNTLESVELLTSHDDASDFERLTEDVAHEIADSAVPIYTTEKWGTFVDLGAYSEDVSELAGDVTDMDELASLALYMIADRLARVILSDLADAIREDDADKADV